MTVDMRRVKAAYYNHRTNARKRGIGWRFTFESWWAIWEPYWHLRGRGTNGLCMARERDDGPYSPENIYLTTNLGNLRDYHFRSRGGIEARQARKELREMQFARAASTKVAAKHEHMSHIAYKALNTSKAVCNIKEEELE